MCGWVGVFLYVFYSQRNKLKLIIPRPKKFKRFRNRKSATATMEEDKAKCEVIQKNGREIEEQQ